MSIINRPPEMVRREYELQEPIAAAVDAVLRGRLGIAEAIAGLLERPLKREG